MAAIAVSANDVSVAINIVARRGDTFKRWIRFRKNGIEQVLSTNSYRMQVKSGLQIKIEFASNVGDSLRIGESTGVIILYKSAAEMQLLDPGVYQYDFQETSGDGFVKTLFAGSFTITDDITKLLS